MNNEELKAKLERIRIMQDYVLEAEKSTGRTYKLLIAICIILCGLLCILIGITFIYYLAVL